MEPILTPNPNRFILFPIQYHDIFKMYKGLISVRWIAEEIDTSKDYAQFLALRPGEQHFIKRILGFFAGSDGIVNENLAANFSHEVQIPEAKAFYSEQMANETCHSETYCRLIDTYIKDPEEKLNILRSITTQPYVAKKAEWATSYFSTETDFATRLVAFAVVEGVFFSGAFCAIFFFKQKGILPGLTLSNEFISRDEGLHTEFACLLYRKLIHPLSEEKVHKLIREAVVIEKEFINDALPCSLIGMNAESMAQYLEYVADRLLISLGYSKTYHSTNPFQFMERQALQGKDNFFEKRVSTYALANCGVSDQSRLFSTTEEF